VSSHAFFVDCLQPYIDDFTRCCIDDIIIFSTIEEEHEDDVQKVLQRYTHFRLLRKAEMWQCQGRFDRVLGNIKNFDRLVMEADRIFMIKVRAIPESVHEVQDYLGSTNF